MEQTINNDYNVCPFCGGAGMLDVYGRTKDDTHVIHIKCNKCGAQGQSFKVNINDLDDMDAKTVMAVNAWNTRITD